MDRSLLRLFYCHNTTVVVPVFMGLLCCCTYMQYMSFEFVFAVGFTLPDLDFSFVTPATAVKKLRRPSSLCLADVSSNLLTPACVVHESTLMCYIPSRLTGLLEDLEACIATAIFSSELNKRRRTFAVCTEPKACRAGLAVSIHPQIR